MTGLRRGGHAINFDSAGYSGTLFCNIYIHFVKVDVRLLVGFLEDLNTCHRSVCIDRQAHRGRRIKFYHTAAAGLLKDGLDRSSTTTWGRSECNASR